MCLLRRIWRNGPAEIVRLGISISSSPEHKLSVAVQVGSDGGECISVFLVCMLVGDECLWSLHGHSIALVMVSQ